MKISKQARREAKSRFAACQRNGLLDENCVRQAVDQLLSQKPRGHLAILTHLQRLVKLDVERRSVRVESAVELAPEQREKVKSQLQARYGQGLSFAFAVNPALLGGVRIKVGSDVFDGTIRGRLNELEQSFEAA